MKSAQRNQKWPKNGQNQKRRLQRKQALRTKCPKEAKKKKKEYNEISLERPKMAEKRPDEKRSVKENSFKNHRGPKRAKGEKD